MQVRTAFGCMTHASRLLTALRTIWTVAMPVTEAAGDRRGPVHRPLMVWIVGGLIAVALFAALVSV